MAAKGQKEKTIQFWDDYYTTSSAEAGNSDNQNKEWIVEPSLAVLETLYAKLPPPSTSTTNQKIHILEIGCGTSSLARDLWLYCRDQKGRRDVCMVATDVSHICIQQNRERDQECMQLLTQENEGCLEYEVFDIVSPIMAINAGDDDDETEDETIKNQPDDSDNSEIFLPRQSCYDMILDKGCLDTFLFRSRKRGENKDLLMSAVLNNIHALLRDPPSSTSADESGGVYTIQTPRGKFRPVQKYPGFAKVERTLLDETKGILVPSASPDVKQNGSLKREKLFLYSCYKGDHQLIMQQQKEVPTAAVVPLVDTDTCPKCGLSFSDFRNGEDVKGQGVKFWTRLYRGHCKHCKGHLKKTNDTLPSRFG